MLRFDIYYFINILQNHPLWGWLLQDLADCQSIQFFKTIRLLAVDLQRDTERSVCQHFVHQK